MYEAIEKSLLRRKSDGFIQYEEINQQMCEATGNSSLRRRSVGFVQDEEINPQMCKAIEKSLLRRKSNGFEQDEEINPRTCEAIENSSLGRRSVGFVQDEEINQNGDAPFTPGIYYPKNKSVHRFRLKSSRPVQRVVLKNGEFNIEKAYNKPFKISNWFITMVEARWRWTLLNFFVAFTVDWLFFGFIYWIIALVHEDLNLDHLPSNSTEWIPCVENIYGFTSSFLFSIEVHTTVAYGRRAITLECPQAILAMCLQCILSSIFQAFMVGILFAKLTRPKSRTQTILVSKQAVVNLRNEKLCLIFRVGDMRVTRILNIKASAYIIRMHNTVKYIDSSEQIELKTEIDGCESTFFLWPVSVIHVIDSSSPLYKISAADLMCGSLEILVVFEGTIETTGQPVQVRSSFTENDILWGHRFIRMIEFDYSINMYAVDFSKLSVTTQIDTPLCSAAEYEETLTFIKSIENIEKPVDD